MKHIILATTVFLIMQCSVIQFHPSTQITEKEIHDHIAYLASDELEGRKPGTPQGRAAAEYIATQFQAAGLSPMGEDGYQYFDVVTSVSLGEDNSFSAGDIAGTVSTDFVPLVFSANAQVTAELAFAGYGFQFESDTLSWDDYKDLDAEGKWVIVMRGNPENDQQHSTKYEAYSSLRRKLMLARDHGAAGVIFVSGEKFDKEDALRELYLDRNFSRASLPVIHAKRSLIDQLLHQNGHSISSLESSLDSLQVPASFVNSTLLEIHTEVIQQEVTTQNVIAMLPGQHPELKDEIILIGGHYDHLGWGGKGSGSRRPDTTAIHNGADDNASGTAAVIEIAEELAAHHEQLNRSVLFMAFGAEEMGLLGSKYFTSNPLLDVKQIKHMLNLDMVGRLHPEKKTLTVGGTGTAVGIEELLKSKAEKFDFELSLTPEGYGPSDHASFYIEDVPVLFFFTGITEEYHTPEDDLETINIKGERYIAEYAFELALELAQRDEAFAFQEAGPKGPPKGGRRGKIKMGIIPDFAGSSSEGFLLGGIVPGGPAALAGMEKGDVMISLEGKSVKNVYDYMGRMAEVKAGDRVSVEVLRNGEKLILIVQL